jgi:hypothetical protein
MTKESATTPDDKKRARARVHAARLLIGNIERTLSPHEVHQLVPGDKWPLELALAHLRPAFEILVRAIEPLDEQQPSFAALLYGALINLTFASYEIGVRGTGTASAKNFFREETEREKTHRHFANMRDKKAEKRATRALDPGDPAALLDQIIKGAGQYERLGTIQRDIVAAGLPPLHHSTISRRRKKLLHL